MKRTSVDFAMSVCGLTASVGRRIHLAIVREVSSLAETLRLRREDSSPSAWGMVLPDNLSTDSWKVRG